MVKHTIKIWSLWGDLLRWWCISSHCEETKVGVGAVGVVGEVAVEVGVGNVGATVQYVKRVRILAMHTEKNCKKKKLGANQTVDIFKKLLKVLLLTEKVQK